MRRLSRRLLPELPRSARRPQYDRDKLDDRHGAYRRRRLPSLSPGRIRRRHARSAVRAVGRIGREPQGPAPDRSPRAAGLPLFAHAASRTRAPRRASSARSAKRSTSRTRRAPRPPSPRLPAPSIRVATITVTEKGYCLTPATGALDLDNPDARSGPRGRLAAAHARRTARARARAAARRPAGPA